MLCWKVFNEDSNHICIYFLAKLSGYWQTTDVGVSKSGSRETSREAAVLWKVKDSTLGLAVKTKDSATQVQNICWRQNQRGALSTQPSTQMRLRPQTWWLHKRNVFSYSSGGWKSKIRRQNGEAPGRALLLPCRELSSHRVLTRHLLGANKPTNPTGFESYPLWPH